MNVLLIVNTSASSVTARARVVIRKALSADHDVTMVETGRRGHATRLALDAAAVGTDVVVVLGGDGTLNEAANGLAGSETALATLPGGSTNVFARTIGVVDDPIEATGQLLAALSRGAIRRIGLGSVNGRYFLFHVGCGFDAAVVEQVERRAGLKRYAGHPLFVYAGFDTWFRHYDRSRPRFAVQFKDGSTVDGYLCICLNTNPYTYLGSRPLNLAPEADLDHDRIGPRPGQPAPPRPEHRLPQRPRRARRQRPRAVPVPGRRRPPGRGRPAGVPARARPAPRRDARGGIGEDPTASRLVTSGTNACWR